MTEHPPPAQLLEKWQAALDDFDGPGAAMLVEGWLWCVAGLIVRPTYDGPAHHFRLHQDETAVFIECPEDPDSSIALDPMTNPCRDWLYHSDGVPQAVSARLDALDVIPRWRDACPDGAHEFETVNKGSQYAYVGCGKCEFSRHTLSWLGHSVPTYGRDRDKPRPLTSIYISKSTGLID